MINDLLRSKFSILFIFFYNITQITLAHISEMYVCEFLLLSNLTLPTFDTLITCQYVRFKVIRAGVVSFEEGLYVGNMTFSLSTAVLRKKGSYISAKRIRER